MEKKKNMLLGLMQLVGANGGNLESRIVLQKQAYVLGHEGFSHFPVGSFTYHHFGPFSRELSDCLQFAKSSGLLSEHVEVGANDGTKYSYKMTQAGEEFLKDAGDIDDKFASLVANCRKEHWRTMELAATALFLGDRDKLNAQPAFDRALALKPETVTYKEKAKSFLSNLAS